MTIIAGFSSSRQGRAPLHLAAQISRCTGDKIIATAIVERPGPPKADPIEDEYFQHVTSQASRSLERVVGQLPGNLDMTVLVHQSTSIPTGLMELAAEHNADLVVVGSSSSGLLGRVALGSVTERLVHTAAVPVAIAPRGYPMSPGPISRLTAAYGGAADAVGLIATSAELAKRWSVRLRIASFTVRPVAAFAGGIEPSVEDLVVQQWSRRTFDDIVKQLNDVRVSHRDSGRRRRGRNRLRVARGGRRCSLGNWRHAVAGVRGGRSGGASFPRLGGLENPASRAGSGDDRPTTPSAGLTASRSPPSTMQSGP